MASIYDSHSGSGSRLPTQVLVLAGVSTVIAVCVSALSITLQLKNYRKPVLQRMVVRIMLMVPIYAVSSLISLFSLEAAFVIDAVRDIYEAFVIYCFFELLLGYLGGERSLLIMLHGRNPKEPVFPINLFKREIDFSDPYTFLFLKRGTLQYVQVKPILAAATLILKFTGKYNEGDFRANSGYLYISVIYNISICLALYCLGMFWMCVNDDLKPFRPVPKFLCVKGILFFSFWQSIGISLLVAAHAIVRLGPYTDAEHISVGLNDTLICLEMPLFAIAHNYAFSYKDFIDPHTLYVARMTFYHAFRDAFGARDVIEDSKATLRGEGMDYRDFEPAEGFMHQGVGRDRRIRAGLRYSKGGQRKYWLPKTTDETQAQQGRTERVTNRVISKVAGIDQIEDVYAPLLSSQARDVVHLAPDLRNDQDQDEDIWGGGGGGELIDDGYDLPFGELDEGDEELFNHSRKYIFGDYNYPCIDVSSEQARMVMWSEEERVLSDERSAWFSPIRGAKGRTALEGREGPVWEGYGAVGSTSRRQQRDDEVVNYKQSRLDEEDLQSTTWTKPRGKEKGSIPDKFSSRSPSSDNNQRGGGDDGGGVVSRTAQISTSTSKQASSSSGPSSAGSSSQSLRLANNHFSIVNRVRSPPSISRNTTSGGTGRSGSGSSHGGSPILPPDAVDLVVADHKAGEEERTKDRRKGEPAVRGGVNSGLRRIYRRGYEVETSNTSDGDVTLNKGQGQAEVEDLKQKGSNRGRVEADERVLDEVREDDDYYSSHPNHHYTSTDQPKVWESESGQEGVVARAQTPPDYVQALNSPYGLPEDDNPWA